MIQKFKKIAKINKYYLQCIWPRYTLEKIIFEKSDRSICYGCNGLDPPLKIIRHDQRVEWKDTVKNREVSQMK